MREYLGSRLPMIPKIYHFHISSEVIAPYLKDYFASEIGIPAIDHSDGNDDNERLQLVYGCVKGAAASDDGI